MWEMVKTFEEATASDDFVNWILGVSYHAAFFVAPFFLGFVLFTVGIRKPRRRSKLIFVLLGVLFSLRWGVIIVVKIYSMLDETVAEQIDNDDAFPWESGFLLWVPFAFLAYYMVHLFTARGAIRGPTITATAFFAAWWQYWIWKNQLQPRFGLYVAAGATALGLIALLLESRYILGSWKAVLFRDILALPVRHAESDHFCDACDYPLIGLPAPRCPECGTENVAAIATK